MMTYKALRKKEYKDNAIENKLLYKCQEGMRKQVNPKGVVNEIVDWAHNVGHFSVKKTMELIEKDYFISSLQQEFENFKWNCVPYILGSKKQGKQEVLLNPIFKEDVPLHTLHIDHRGSFPSTTTSYQICLC